MMRHNNKLKKSFIENTKKIIFSSKCKKDNKKPAKNITTFIKENQGALFSILITAFFYYIAAPLYTPYFKKYEEGHGFMNFIKTAPFFSPPLKNFQIFQKYEKENYFMNVIRRILTSVLPYTTDPMIHVYQPFSQTLAAFFSFNSDSLSQGMLGIFSLIFYKNNILNYKTMMDSYSGWFVKGLAYAILHILLQLIISALMYIFILIYRRFRTVKKTLRHK
jgi:hypothetical protein